MAKLTAADVIENWPKESREAAKLVLDKYGEPTEVSDSRLLWERPGPWKRMVARREYFDHRFPMPHTDSVESVIDYHVPVEKFDDLAEFDGSVVVERTAGEVLARCHDEQANFLALNLMHEIVTGSKSVQEARDYYAQEMLNYRRKEPAPYMEKLHFQPQDGDAADPDERIIAPEQIEKAVEEGRQRA